MMRWPWRRAEARGSDNGEIEARASADYTDVLTALLTARAEGGPVDPAATAALECAAGLVARSFAVAKVEPEGARTAALRPSVLASIGRQLIRHGDVLFALRVRQDRVQALPVPHWEVHGEPDPDSWWYRLDLPGPDANATITLPAAGVLHFRFASDPREPWRGIAPLAWASATGKLSGALEQALGGEAAGPFGFVLPLPDVQTDKTALKVDLAGLRGGVKLVDTVHSGWGEGRGAAPARDWRQERIGANPPESVVSLRENVYRAVLSATGVPPPLVSTNDGTAAREAWRRFLHGTIHPLGAMVAEEAGAKLGIDVSLSFDKLFASDLTGRARAFQSMVGAGMDTSKAASLAGLMATED